MYKRQGVPCADAGGARDRTSQHLCADDHDDPCAPLCGKGEQKSLCDRAGRGREQNDEGRVPDNRGRELYGEHGSTFRPVSYTHLDVYKRQIRGRSAGSTACSAEAA